MDAVFPHSFLNFESGSHYVVQAGLEFEIFLLQPPKCWDDRRVLWHLARVCWGDEDVLEFHSGECVTL
jgi:hypothetical protein